MIGERGCWEGLVADKVYLVFYCPQKDFGATQSDHDDQLEKVLALSNAPSRLPYVMPFSFLSITVGISRLGRLIGLKRCSGIVTSQTKKS